MRAASSGHRAIPRNCERPEPFPRSFGMMQRAGSFEYDVVLSLTASPRVRERLSRIERALGSRRLLAATLNHRFHSLHDKNVIKGTIEAHGLDHLMFSMRPSSRVLLTEASGVNLE